MKYDAIVIGAGPNGLTAAAVLAKRGKKVLVLEAANEIGGHTRAIEFAPGIRAPLNGDPGWVPPAVEKELGQRFDYGKQRVWRFSVGEDSRRFDEFYARMQKFAGILAALYQIAPPDIGTSSPAELMPLMSVGLKLKGLGRADMVEFMRVLPMPVQDLLDDTFADGELKTSIASAAIRDLRQGPRSAGTTFNLLHYMIGSPQGFFRRQLWLPDGPDAFAKAAERKAIKAGAEIVLGKRVAQIMVKDGAVTGVATTGGGEYSAPLVLSTADPKQTLLGLVDPIWLDPEFMLAVKNIKLRGCTAFVFYALSREVDSLDSHTHNCNTSMEAIEKAADAAKYGEMSNEPVVDYFAPSERWPNFAPGNKSVIAARVQYAPYHLKNDSWDKDRAASLGAKVTAAISRDVPGFESLIEHRAVLTPVDVEKQFGVTEGAITQGEMTLDQILFMRPVPGWGHYEMPVRGLYLAGSGAHPGPGVLGGAGLLAAKAALR